MPAVGAGYFASILTHLTLNAHAFNLSVPVRQQLREIQKQLPSRAPPPSLSGFTPTAMYRRGCADAFSE
jgi:hypothetical protein